MRKLKKQVENSLRSTVREADEEHTGHRAQANQEAGSIVLHVGNDTDEKEKTAISSEAVCHEGEVAMEHKREETNGEQTDNVIETDCLGEKIEKKNNDEKVRKADDEELPEHCTQTDEEASSIVLHVGHDMNEKEKTDSMSGVICYEEEITMNTREKKQMKQQQQKHMNPMMRSQRGMWKKEDSSRREEAHPKGRNND